MEALISLEIGIITWLQSIGEWLVPVMRFFSFLGTEQFYLLIAPVIYWCLDSRLGLRLGIYMMLSNSLNCYLKLIFHAPRPFWISSSVKGFSYEPSFGFPSGHSGNAAVFFPTLASGYLKSCSTARKQLIWAITMLIIVLVGFSRIILGMHFPHDVLSGFLAGFLSLLIFMRLSGPVSLRMQKQSVIVQVFVLLALSLVLILIGILALAITNISGFRLPADWIANSTVVESLKTASPEKPPVNPFELSPIISSAAGFFGLGAGDCIMKAKGGFNVSGTSSALVFRYFLGMAGLFILWSGLGMVFPRGESLVPYILRFFRYSLAGFWVTAFAPILFIKLRLAEKPMDGHR